MKNLEALLEIEQEASRLNFLKGIVPDSVKHHYDPKQKISSIQTGIEVERIANEIGEDVMAMRMDKILREEIPEFKIYDRKGNEISFLQKCEYDQDPNYRIVANESYKDIRVMTIWDGLNHGIKIGKFLIFSTAVISDEKYMLYEFFHSTEQEAKSNHQNILSIVKRSLDSGSLDHQALKRIEISLEKDERNTK